MWHRPDYQGVSAPASVLFNVISCRIPRDQMPESSDPSSGLCGGEGLGCTGDSLGCKLSPQTLAFKSMLHI